MPGGTRALLRSALERLSRGVVLRRRMPRDLGGARLYVSPDAALRFWRPGALAADRPLLAAARRLVRSGMRVWDIGANVGLFAFAAAGLSGRVGAVVAVEPDPWLAGLLRASAALAADGHARVEVLGAAVAERPGIARLAIAARGRCSNALAGLGRETAGGKRSEIAVPMLTLDVLLEACGRPDLVKIDVEGAEALVLRGARRLLAEARPTFYLEVGDEQADEVTGLLTSAGYRLFDLKQAEPRPVERATWATLAVAG